VTGGRTSLAQAAYNDGGDPAMDEILTIDEIESRYHNEWVLVLDPETNEALEVVSGKIGGHGPNPDELYKQVQQLRPKSCAVFYAGKLPTNYEFVL
jgi:hypothetical protein